MSIEETMQSMGLALPPPPSPVASYIPAVQAGNLIYVSGQLPFQNGVLTCAGRVPADLDEAAARDGAKLAALNGLAAAKAVVGDLEQISRVVKVTGYVRSADGFAGQPGVVNGASDLLVALFGERGRHARAAVGVSELPLGAAVEIELILAVESPGH